MRYTVALPAALLGGHTAFTPNMTRVAAGGAQQYKYDLIGQPGTVAIPAPTTDTAAKSGAVAQSMMGTARSQDAPDSWYPQQYYRTTVSQERPGAGMPIRVYSDNMLPVPAIDPRGLPTLLAFTPHFLGQQQLAQPQSGTANWGGNV